MFVKTSQRSGKHRSEIANRSGFRHRALLIAAASALAGVSSSAYAATSTWSGNGANWNNAASWDVLPNPNDILQFTGVNNLASNNDFGANTQFNGINFLAGAGAFTLSGNAVVLGGDISQASTNNQTISLALSLDGATSNVNVTGAGTLSLGSVAYGAAAGNSLASNLNVNNSVSATGMLVRTSLVSNNLAIASGQTLTINGGFDAGVLNPVAGGVTTTLTTSGTGSLVVNSGTNLFHVGLTRANAAAGTDPFTFVNLSGLNNFTFTGTGAGNFRVGNGNSRGELNLASTSNSITSAAVRVGDSGLDNGTTGGSDNNNGGTGILRLGGGTNVINADTIQVGRLKSAGQVIFQGAGGSVSIAGTAGGASTSNITVGSADNGTGANTVSTLLFAGHNANVQAGTVILGQMTANGVNSGRGAITFDTGTFNAQNLRMGVQTGTGVSATVCSGAFTLGGTGVLNVTSQFLLAQRTTATTGASVAEGSFIINGGTANIGTDILDGSTTVSTVGPNNTTLTLSGGTLNMTGKNIGSYASPISTVNLTSGTLSNAAQISAKAINLDAAVTVSGTPKYVLPTAGVLTHNLAPLTLVSGGSIEGGGATAATINGNVQAASGARLAPGSATAASTLSFTNDLSLASGSTVRFKLSENLTGNDQITVGGNLTAAGSVNVELGILGAGPQFGNTYTLFTYAGTLTGNETNFVLPNLNARTTYTIVPTGTTPNQVQLSVGGSPSLALTWIGAPNTATWNLIGNSNWRDNTLASQQFYNLDSVTFDDNSTDLSDVNISGTLQPASVTVNATRNYKWVGSGSIGGTSSVTKTNTGTLTVANTNTYSGTTDINNGTLLLGDGGTTGTLGSGTVNVNGGTLAFNRSDNNTFSNVLAGGATARKIGSNTLTLSGANTFTGTLQISAGTVQVNTVANDGTPNPLGTGGVTQLDGGTLRYGGSANGTSNHSLSLTANGGTLDSSPSAGGVQLVLNGTGGLQLPDPGSRTLTLTGADATPLLIATNQLSAVIGDYDTGGGLLTTINKTGNNRWQLNSANSYSGGTNITAGGMRINNASGFGTGLVTVANGAQAYINTGGTVPNNFTISGVGHDEAPGTEITGQFGSLRVANNGAVLTGTVTLAANARITGRGATTGGNIQGQITGPFALEFGNAGGGNSALIISNSLNDWTGNTTISHGTLKGGAVNVIPSGAGKGNVIINNSSASFDSNLDLNGFDQNINGLSATGADMTRAKVINSTGTATLTVGNNNTSSTYAGSIGGGAGVLGLGKTGTGTQTLTGSLNYNGDTTISAGTLHVNTATAGTAAGNVTGAGTLIKSGPGKLTIGAANLNNLTINAGSVLAMSPRSGVPDLASSRKTLYVHGTFNLDAAGTLDTANNDIAIDNSTFNDVFGQVLAGFGNPNGPGITSSTSDGSQIHALFDNALVGITDWNGASVGANAIVGKYTYFGDANIDGQVTGDDYGVIDANLDTTPPVGLGWLSGDMNLDGSVTGDDYGVIDANLGLGTGNPLTPSSLSVVPEPTGIALLATAGGLLFGRRRRTR